MRQPLQAFGGELDFIGFNVLLAFIQGYILKIYLSGRRLR